MSRVRARSTRQLAVRQRLRRRRGHPHARRARDAGPRRRDRHPAAGDGRRRRLTRSASSTSSGAPSRSRARGRARREPRSARADWLFELFASLGPGAGDVVVDIGARDGKHLRRLVQEHGAARESRSTPFRRPTTSSRGRSRSCLSRTRRADWIWCRDVLVHVDVERGARRVRAGAEARRTDARVRDACDRPAGTARGRLDHGCVRACDARRRPNRSGCGRRRPRARREGRARRRVARADDRRGRVGCERGALARVAPPAPRHDRRGRRVDAADKVWGVYQLLGKLCPTVYLWERRV